MANVSLLENTKSAYPSPSISINCIFEELIENEASTPPDRLIFANHAIGIPKVTPTLAPLLWVVLQLQKSKLFQPVSTIES
jgi:hypothetical protein